MTANSECEMCFGTGAKPNVPVYVECQECDGTGQDYSANVRHPTTCPTCGGNGRSEP